MRNVDQRRVNSFHSSPVIFDFTFGRTSLGARAVVGGGTEANWWVNVCAFRRAAAATTSCVPDEYVQLGKGHFRSTVDIARCSDKRLKQIYGVTD